MLARIGPPVSFGPSDQSRKRILWAGGAYLALHLATGEWLRPPGRSLTPVPTSRPRAPKFFGHYQVSRLFDGIPPHIRSMTKRVIIVSGKVTVYHRVENFIPGFKPGMLHPRRVRGRVVAINLTMRQSPVAFMSCKLFQASS